MNSDLRTHSTELDANHFTSPSRQRSRYLTIAVLAILLLAAALRLVALDRIPPGLWYDEAIYALDGLDVARGQVGLPIFFSTYGHMREPLYIWSLGAFFATFGHSVEKARLVTALWGIATVAAFWPVARRAAGPQWALAALFAFAVFRWHLHFSRTIFRAALPPLFLLLAIHLFQRWRETRKLPREAFHHGDTEARRETEAEEGALHTATNPKRLRTQNSELRTEAFESKTSPSRFSHLYAFATGGILGLGMYTYLSFRLVPLLAAVYLGWLLWKRVVILRRDLSGLALIAAGWLAVFAPLAIDWLRHPEHFRGRTDEVSMFVKRVETGSAGPVEVRKTPAEFLHDVGRQALQVAAMWTIRGDHVGKHNLPHAPVFDWGTGLVFYVGLGWCILHAARNEWAFLLLAWIGTFSLASIFSFGAPNLLRMQAMTPAVVLTFIIGLRAITDWATRRGVSPALRRATVAAILAGFATHQLYTYFVRFPASAKVRQEFQVETFADPAEAVRQLAVGRFDPDGPLGDSGRTGRLRLLDGKPAATVHVPSEMLGHPSFRFIVAGLDNVRPYAPTEDPLTTSSARPGAILLWEKELRDAKQHGHDRQATIASTPGAQYVRTFMITLTSPDGDPTATAPWARLYLLP